MADEIKPFSSSRQSQFSYETPQPVQQDKNLPVRPEAIDAIASDTSSSRHVNKLLSHMWGLVQRVVTSAEVPIVAKQLDSSSEASTNPNGDVEACFANCRQAFKQLYLNILSPSSNS